MRDGGWTGGGWPGVWGGGSGRSEPHVNRTREVGLHLTPETSGGRRLMVVNIGVLKRKQCNYPRQPGNQVVYTGTNVKRFISPDVIESPNINRKYITSSAINIHMTNKYMQIHHNTCKNVSLVFPKTGNTSTEVLPVNIEAPRTGVL